MSKHLATPRNQRSASLVERVVLSQPRHLYLILALLIATQVAFLTFLGTQKHEFHIDEIYSYLFANSAHAEDFSQADWLFDDWVTGGDFDTLTTVQPGEQFDFAAPYRNTSLDCHPPVFYWTLHAVCSLFPGLFSKWLGLGLNIALFVLAQVFVFLNAKLLLRSNKLALIPVALYGFSAFAINTTLYIRMYMLLTLLVTVFVYQNLIILRDGPRLTNVLPTALTLYLGAMTQYYFLVLAFWLALINGVRLLAGRRFRDAFVYGVPLCAAVVAMLVSFPYAIGHVMGTSTNNVGNEIAKSAFDLKLWAYQIVELSKQVVGGFSFSHKISYAFAAVLLVTAILLWISSRVSGRSPESSSNFDVWMLLATFALTFLTIAKIGGHYVYLRYILLSIPLLYLGCTAMLARLATSNSTGSVTMPQRIGVVATGALVALALAGSMRVAQVGNSAYTYEPSAKSTAAIVEYDDVPLVFMLSEGSDGDVEVTANYTRLRAFERVFVGSKESVLGSQAIQGCLSQGGECLLYLPTDTYWIDGYEESQILDELAPVLGDSELLKVEEVGFGSYYLVATATEASE